MIQGEVTNVIEDIQGAVVVSWAGTAMTVWNAADFSRSGGTFTTDGGTTVWGYTGVLEGDTDEDPDVVLTADPAPADWPSDETRVDIWPLAVDVIAEVATDADDTIPAIVPHALRPVLPPGVRDVDDRERVTLEQRGTEWLVADVVGRAAAITADVLAPDLLARIDSADGKSTLTHSSEAPSGEGALGDTWFRHDDAGHTVGLWRWDGSTWAPLSIDGAVLANLDAGSITTGVISGIDIYSPSESGVPRVHVGGSLIEVVRGDGEGTYTSATLGGPNSDRMQLMNAAGEVIAGFDETGAGAATSLSVGGDTSVSGTLSTDDLLVGGISLADHLAQLPRGLVARQRMGTGASPNNYEFGTTELGLVELRFTADANRTYRVVFDGMVYVTQGGFSLNLRREVVGGDATPVAPSINSPQITTGTFERTVAVAQASVQTHLEALIIGPASAGTQTSYRIMLSGVHRASGGHGRLVTRDDYPAEFYVEDLGPYTSYDDGRYMWGGGTPWTASPPPPTNTNTTPVVQPKTYTSVWNASWARSWRGGSVVTDYLQQGYYGGYQRYSMVGFTAGATSGETGKTLQQALTGSRISKIELLLFNKSFYYGSGGKARIGRHGNATAPASAQTTGGSAFDSPQWTTGTGKWVTLPSGWYSGFATGANRGVTLGEDAGANMTYYGKFDATLSNVRLRVTYTR